MSAEKPQMPGSKVTPEFLSMISRRRFLGGAAAAAAGIAATSLLPRGVDASPLKQFGLANYLAQTLPDDAATDQTYMVATDPAIPKVLDFYEAVYERPGSVADLFSEPLVRLTRDFEIIPGAAESWSSDETVTSWTFKIAEGRMWNDGNPVTANDWVATFQYAADPAHAWDFTWFFDGVLKGFHEAINGEIPPDQIGVHLGANDYELVIETVDPSPYMPAMMLYSLTLSKAALETHGPLYNTKPETHTSSGPFKLESWTPDVEIVVVKNEDYTGPMVVPVNRVICKLAATNTHFSLYQTNEIDSMENPAPQELTLIQADPQLSQELYAGVGDFKTFYLFFDTTKEPFTDLRVRQAFSHVIDRDAIVEKITGIGGVPAYGMLAPGFPGYNGEEWKSIQNFDPEKGKQLLADAGYPNGEGFPKQEMWLRAATPMDQAIAAACAAMIKEHLGIDVEVSNRDQKLFTDALNAKPTEILFGYVSYGMDFLDPINMLSLWKSGGRHSWSNPDFDAALAEAGSFPGDPAERLEMFHGVERILIEDAPAVFVYHVKLLQMLKPWLKGEFKEPDKSGIAAAHWPGYTTMSTMPEELYIGKDAPGRG